MAGADIPASSTIIAASFDPFLERPFRVRGSSAVLSLVEIERRGREPDERPFTLIFTGPSESVLPSGIYSLEHNGTTFELHLMPILTAHGGQDYQAVFN